MKTFDVKFKLLFGVLVITTSLIGFKKYKVLQCTYAVSKINGQSSVPLFIFSKLILRVLHFHSYFSYKFLIVVWLESIHGKRF